MRFILSLTLAALAFSWPGGSYAAQQPAANVSADGMIRVSVRMPGAQEPASGVQLTLTPVPSVPISSLPEAEAALLAYLQSSAGRGAAVPSPSRVVMNPAEARQSLARILQQSSPPVAGILAVGGGVSEPVISQQVLPQYSDEARRDRIQGSVELLLVILGDGTPGAVQITKGPGYGLDEKAAEAVKQWRFLPARQGGTPVPVYVSVSVNFSLGAARGAPLRAAVTDALGNAVFNGLAPGRYAVNGRREEYVGIVSATAAPPSPQPAQAIVLVLSPAAMVSGSVRDPSGAPVPNARVTLGVLITQEGRRTFVQGPEAATNASGEYRFPSILAGDYYVRAQTASTNGVSIVYYPGDPDPDRAASVSIRAGQDVVGIDIGTPK